MIDSVIRWSLDNRLFVLVAAAALVAAGIVRASQMPVDVFPDLTAPSVTIVAEAPGMAPEEVERLVTAPIERAVNGAAGVRRVRSSTSAGSAIVWVDFDWSVDVVVARQIVSERMQVAAPALPVGVSPVLAPTSSIMGEVLFLGLTSTTVSPRELRTIADRDVRRRILGIPGVAQVTPIGGEVQQFQVIARPRDLAEHGVTLDELVEAVRRSNENTAAGFYEAGGQELVIYGLGRVRQVDDIAASVVRPRSGGGALLVRDVADVVLGSAVRRGDATVNGRPGVILGVQKQPGADTMALTLRIEDMLKEVEAQLPEGVELHGRLLVQADFIATSVENLWEALRDGSLLVVLIIGLFLFSGRATLITALAIPMSLLASALVLDAFGVSLNTMTIGGMAIAVGALVDDAIIDVENVVRRLRQRTDSTPHSLIETVFRASKEIRGSIVFATLIIVLVFLPIFFLHGVEGRMLRPLGFAYVTSLAASLVVALTVTPVLCSLLLPRSGAVRRGSESVVVRWLRSAYDPLLAVALRAWPLLAVLSVVGIIAAGVAASEAGRAFLPEFNEGALTVSVVTLPGTSLERSHALARQVESILLRHPEVASTAGRTGRAELDEHAQPVHASEIEVKLNMRDRSEAEFLAALRADLAGVVGANVVIGQPISHRIDHMLSGTRANVAIKVFGPDLLALQRHARRVEAAIADIPGVVDLAIEAQAYVPMVTVRFDRSALARYGLTIGAASDTLATALHGTVATRVFDGEVVFDLVVRYADDARSDLHTIRTTMVPTPTGAWVPLEALADIQRENGPSQISREGAQRHIVVMCNVGDGHDLDSVVGAIQGRVRDDVPLPAGYHIAYGGQFEAAAQATRTLAILGALVVLGVFLLLIVALTSIRDAALVMVNLPLALIGGVVGVYIGGGVISIASIIGFITLFGIATRNGIMLVTHIRHLMEVEGVRDPVQAVRQGASERLAPILMTAMASGLGLLPLALAGGHPGSEIQTPMALVILAGLTTSTTLNMFVVPAMMLRFGSIRPRT